MNNTNLTTVLRFIEENMRVTEQTSIEYLDSQGVMGRLKIKQNHMGLYQITRKSVIRYGHEKEQNK